jgi:hypothetical protein
MSASTTTTTLQPLEKLTPRQQEVGQTTATSNDQAAAAAAAAITAAAAAAATTTTSAQKKRPLTLDINTKFDPESPSTYHSSVLCCWLFPLHFLLSTKPIPLSPYPPPYVNSQLQITIHVWYTKGHDHAQRKSKIICFLSKNTSVEATGNHQRRRTFTARTTKTNTDHTRKPTPKPRRSILRRQQMVLALQP